MPFSKPVCKLIDVIRKCPCEWFVIKRSSRQHGFAKPFSAVSILMLSICFYELVLLFLIFHQNFCNSNVGNFVKGYVRWSNLSINEFLMRSSFIYHEFHSFTIFNIPQRNVLFSSHRFYHFSFSFYEYLCFISSVFILRARFEPAQNLSSDFVEWSCAAVITSTPWCHTTPRHHYYHLDN